MLSLILQELVRFLLLISVVVLLYLIVGTLLGYELRTNNYTMYNMFLQLFKAFNGEMALKEYIAPVGHAYIGSFMFLFNVLMLSLLSAMFINKYKEVYKNIDAYKRFRIIRMKNSQSYDLYLGGGSLTFFPINIIVLPFLLPIMVVRSRRLSDFALKIQYTAMIGLYCLILVFLLPPSFILLYLKMLANSIYILLNRQRQDFRFQNVVHFFTTLVAGPFLILASTVVDFLSLPQLLLRK